MKNVKGIILEAVHTHTSNLMKVNKKALKICFINLEGEDVE